MSLKIIYGTVNSGKTEKCFEYIKNIIDTTNEKVFYIVPDQYSLEAERTVSKRFSKIALDRIEVSNPDRLAKRVFSTVGPVMCDFLDDNAKLMIIEKAIIKVSGKLTYFMKNTQFDGFSSVVLDIIKQFKANCIDCEVLKDIAENSSNLKFKVVAKRNALNILSESSLILFFVFPTTFIILLSISSLAFIKSIVVPFSKNENAAEKNTSLVGTVTKKSFKSEFKDSIGTSSSTVNDFVNNEILSLGK